MKKIVSLLIVIVMMASFVTACSKDTGKYEDVYYSTFSGEYKTLNPYDLTAGPAYTMVGNSIDGLVENDRYGMIVPSLAESWTNNEDFTVWTFKLRQNIFWV